MMEKKCYARNKSKDSTKGRKMKHEGRNLEMFDTSSQESYLFSINGKTQLYNSIKSLILTT